MKTNLQNSKFIRVHPEKLNEFNHSLDPLVGLYSFINRNTHRCY